MSQLFSKSILLHFPSEIYLRRGVGELFPLLVRALHENEIVAMQFLRVGAVRVIVRYEAYREDLVSSEFPIRIFVLGGVRFPGEFAFQTFLALPLLFSIRLIQC